MVWEEVLQKAQKLARQKAAAHRAEAAADAAAPMVVPPYLRTRVQTFSLARGVPLSSRRSVLEFLVVPRVLSTPDVAGKLFLAALCGTHDLGSVLGQPTSTTPTVPPGGRRRH